MLYPMNLSRHHLTAATIGMVAILAIATAVVAIGQGGGVSITVESPADGILRAGDAYTLNVTPPGNYQARLVNAAAERGQAGSCATLATPDEPVLLGPVTATDGAAKATLTGYVPPTVPYGEYKVCVQWVVDNDLRFAIGNPKLFIVGRVSFVDAGEAGETALTLANAKASSPVAYYAQTIKSLQCDGTRVALSGDDALESTTDEGAHYAVFNPLHNGFDGDQRICAAGASNELLGYGVLKSDTLSPEAQAYLSPSEVIVPAGNAAEVEVRVRRRWPTPPNHREGDVYHVIAYAKGAADAECAVAQEAAPAHATVVGAPVLPGATATRQGALTVTLDPPWLKGDNQVCIGLRRTRVDGDSASLEVAGGYFQELPLVIIPAAPSTALPLPPGAQYAHEQDLAGRQLKSLSWNGRTFPADAVSSLATHVTFPLEMHVVTELPTGAAPPYVERSGIRLHWIDGGSTPLPVIRLVALTPVVTQHEGEAYVTASLRGVNNAPLFTPPDRGMEAYYCNGYLNPDGTGGGLTLGPRRFLGEGTVNGVAATPDDLVEERAFRSGANRICLLVEGWATGHDRHAQAGVHPAVVQVVFTLQPRMEMPAEHIIGNAVDIRVLKLPEYTTYEPGDLLVNLHHNRGDCVTGENALLREDIVLERGAAYTATNSSLLGDAQVKLVLPERVGDVSAVNKWMKVKIAYSAATEDEVLEHLVQDCVKALPVSTPTRDPAGLQGVPYLTFSPRSATVREELNVNVKNLYPSGSILQALRLNGTLVYGSVGEASVNSRAPTYVAVRSATTLGRPWFSFTMPARIGDEVTGDYVKLEVHYQPPPGQLDQYGNEVIVIQKTVALYQEGQKPKVEECDTLAVLDPEQHRAGSSLGIVRLLFRVGSAQQPVQCAGANQRARPYAMPDGELFIKLQGDLGGLPRLADSLQPEVTAHIFESADMPDGQLPPGGSQVGQYSVQPANAVNVNSVGTRSVTITKGTRITRAWSYKDTTNPSEIGPCTQVPLEQETVRLANLTPGTQYVLSVFNTSDCAPRSGSPEIRVEFTTKTVSELFSVASEAIDAEYRGDVVNIRIPGCEDWNRAGVDADSTQYYEGCRVAKARHVLLTLRVEGLTMPRQASRSPDERVVFSVEWEKRQLDDSRDVLAYVDSTFTAAAPSPLADTPASADAVLEPDAEALSRLDASFIRYGASASATAYGHFGYTAAQVYTAHIADLAATNHEESRPCAELVGNLANIPDARTQVTARNQAQFSIRTNGGKHDRIGMYYVCAKDQAGIVTSDAHREDDALVGPHVGRLLVGMSVTHDQSTGREIVAGGLVRFRIHGRERTQTQNAGQIVNRPLLVNEMVIGSHRMVGPAPAGQGPDTRHWVQEGDRITVRMPSDISGAVNVRIWARSPVASADQTCTPEAHTDENLATAYEAACYATLNVSILEPTLWVDPSTARLNDRITLVVGNLPGAEICTAILGPAKIVLLDGVGRETECVPLRSEGQETRIQAVVRMSENRYLNQEPLIRYFLSAGASGTDPEQTSGGDEETGADIYIISDQNAQAEGALSLIAPSVIIKEPSGAVAGGQALRRLDRIVLRGEDFPRADTSRFRIDFKLGDCDAKCRQSNVTSRRLWEFDHVVRRQPAPPRSVYPIEVRLNGVEVPLNNELKAPNRDLVIYPDRGQAEDLVTVMVSGIEAYRAGYSVAIYDSRSGYRGPQITFNAPPQTDGAGGFEATGQLPWYEHEGTGKVAPLIFQLFDGTGAPVPDAEFTFDYVNRNVPATPRPTRPGPEWSETVADTPGATPRPLLLQPTATPPPPTVMPTPTLDPTPLPTLPPIIEPTPTTAPEPLRSIAGLVRDRTPTPAPPTPTPAPITLVGVTEGEVEELPRGDPIPWKWIIIGLLALLVVTAVAIVIFIWKRPPDAMVTPMGRVSEDDAPDTAPRMVTGTGYFDAGSHQTSLGHDAPDDPADPVDPPTSTP